MFKKHLHTVYRKNNLEDKTLSKYILTQNERNFKLDKTVYSKFLKSIKETDIKFYPDTSKVKKLIAKDLNITTDNLVLTPGSDVAIKTLFEALEFEDGYIITTDYHFPMYKVYSELYNVPIEFVNYKNNLAYSVSDILFKITEKTKLIILANPNSPLGDYKSYQELEPVLKTGIPILIDEAYIELSDKESFVKYLNEYPNLFISKTFSKGFGAAGCRVGFMISNKENIDILSKFRLMYEIPALSAKYIEFILNNKKKYTKYLKKTLKQKSTLVKQLKNKMPVIDTDSTWFFIEETLKIKTIFEKHKVSYRTTILPGREASFIKFNYDLVLHKSKFIDDLIS